MKGKIRYINAGGKLLDLKIPRVMGILNVTPDSFYSGSRFMNETDIIGAAVRMKEEGADILDIGGYSSRPGAHDVSAAEEGNRVLNSLTQLNIAYRNIMELNKTDLNGTNL